MIFEEILDQLDEIIDAAWALPLSGGKCLVDAEEMRDYVQQLRENLPAEIKNAKAIVQDRTEIIQIAKSEGEGIVCGAEEKARQLVAREEIVRQAEQRAKEILLQAQMKAKEIRKATNEYVERLLDSTEESVNEVLVGIRATKKGIRSVGSLDGKKGDARR